MRIAFASCMSTRICPDQPVWDWIRAQQPDRLVLLGDSLYLDLSQQPMPQDMQDDDFAQHLFTMYRELLEQPQFAALVAAMPAGTVDAIWDDHDFLWNDARGAEMHPVHSGKVQLSTAFFEVFRATLHQQLAVGSFPAAYTDPAFWNRNQPLSTPSIPLAPDLWLHLSDGRTFRTRTHLKAESKRTIFGQAQRARFTAAIEAAPGALHLWASGSTMAGYERYANDRAWLKDLASRQRMLMLSGDIHRNQFDAFSTAGFMLHEATSSGAAILDAVVFGEPQRNYGLLEVDANKVHIQVFQQNNLEDSRVLARDTWLAI